MKALSSVRNFNGFSCSHTALISLNGTPQNHGAIINVPHTEYYESSAVASTAGTFSKMPPTLTSSLSKLFSPITIRLAARNNALYEYGLTPGSNKETRKREKAWYKRLPPARTPKYIPFEDKDGMSPQLQCSFFSKLPLELRQMIYELALSGQTCYIEILNRKYQEGDKSFFKLRALRNAITLFKLAKASKLA